MEILLKKNELIDLGEPMKGNTIICLSGCCWLTQSGDSRDHILRSGNLYSVSQKGQLVITATSESRIKLAAEPEASKAGSAWQTLACSN